MNARYRFYIDEVGTDGLSLLDVDSERFLSLTGIAMRTDEARDALTPKLHDLKASIFKHDPDEPVILHRKKIMKFSGPFKVLRDEDIRKKFDAAIIDAMSACDYRVITALIDKRAMVRKIAWTNKEPYHYLMEVLIEKFTQFLERNNAIGDIMPEGRMGKKDERLQAAFEGVRANGTYYVSRERVQTRLPSSKLKFRYKKDNIAGLQLADLIAHPSHMTIRKNMQHSVNLGTFCQKVKAILMDAKYDRSGYGRVIGYGMKWLP